MIRRRFSEVEVLVSRGTRTHMEYEREPCKITRVMKSYIIVIVVKVAPAIVPAS